MMATSTMPASTAWGRPPAMRLWFRVQSVQGSGLCEGCKAL